MSLIGKLTEFNSASEKWEDYIERFEFFVEANKITSDAEKRCTLLTAVGAKTYAIIKFLASPTSPKDVSYAEIIKKCNGHFGKIINELLARVKFQKRDQHTGEDLKDFVRELRKLAQDCKYGGGADKLPLDIMLRDRFVAGIRDEKLQRYLCRRHEESVTNTNKNRLSLEKALEIACSVESTEEQQKLPKQGNTNKIQTSNLTIIIRRLRNRNLK